MFQSCSQYKNKLLHLLLEEHLEATTQITYQISEQVQDNLLQGVGQDKQQQEALRPARRQGLLKELLQIETLQQDKEHTHRVALLEELGIQAQQRDLLEEDQIKIFMVPIKLKYWWMMMYRNGRKTFGRYLQA